MIVFFRNFFINICLIYEFLGPEFMRLELKFVLLSNPIVYFNYFNFILNQKP